MVCQAYTQSSSHLFYQDTIEGKPLNEIVVLASKSKQILLKAPISIQKLKRSQLLQSGSSTFFDALEHIKGIQMITPSLGFKVINARGFTNTTNVRFTQLVDGMDIQSPHIGAPIGNALGPSDLDIRDVEIIPGVASTLFGVNSINGLANFSTLSPFDKKGLSVLQKTGINHLNDTNTKPHLFTETSLRYANLITKKFGYKFNLSYIRGYDWVADNKTELNPLANVSTNLIGYSNPAQDQVNVYGNESSNRKTITLQGKSFVVARTGFSEAAVADYHIQNIKSNLNLYYQFTKDAILSYSTNISVLNNIYQRSNRFMLKDYLLQQNAIQFQSKNFSFKAYTNNENSGNAYNLRSMAENIDRNFKSDALWYNDYAYTYNKSLIGDNYAIAHQLARANADAGRLEPGSDQFKSILQKLSQINNWDTGAALKVMARLLHVEAQIDLANLFFNPLKQKGFEAIFGIDNRSYMITPDGNYFINPVNKKTSDVIYYSKNGGYISVSQFFLKNKLQFSISNRLDKNDYFKVTSNPRYTAIYLPNSNQSVRFSYSKGYRFPSIFEAFSNINSGGVKRIGGLPVMSSGVYENSWLANSMSLFQSAVLNDMNKNGMNKTDAILKEKKLLVKNSYGYIQPENIQSIEMGYRASLLKGRFIVDVDFYYNRYRNFIAQTNVNVPNTSVPDSIPFALNDKSTYNQYRIWTNSKTKVFNNGASIGLQYRSTLDFQYSFNASYSHLYKTLDDDALEDGFNTPNWTFNSSISNKKIYQNFGAGVSYRWQSSYFTQTFLVNGITPSFGTLDAYISHKLPMLNLSIKLGASNLLNKYYFSYLGGPGIGGMYYLSITY